MKNKVSNLFTKTISLQDNFADLSITHDSRINQLQTKDAFSETA